MFKRKKNDKKYYQKNKEKINERCRKYNQKNREELNKYAKTYYQKNLKKKREYNQKYYQENLDKIREHTKKYDKENIERTRARCRHHRAKRLEAEGNHTFGEWELLKKQYGYICPCCKKKEPEIKLTEDHIIPLSKGGSDYIENIQPLCKSCNSKKHTKIIGYKNYIRLYPITQ